MKELEVLILCEEAGEKNNWRIKVMKELEVLILTWREQAGQKPTGENSDEGAGGVRSNMA